MHELSTNPANTLGIYCMYSYVPWPKHGIWARVIPPFFGILIIYPYAAYLNYDPDVCLEHPNHST